MRANGLNASYCCLDDTFLMQISYRQKNETYSDLRVNCPVFCPICTKLFFSPQFFLIKVPNINLLTPNDDYSGRTALLTSKCCILYIYSTNIGTEYFKHGIYSPFFALQNAVCFIILTYLVPVLFTFYIQSVLKLKT